MPLPLPQHLLDPRYLARTASRLADKWLRRIRRIDQKTVRLEAKGASDRGRAVLSYIIDPVLGDGASIEHSHTHFWESRQIAVTLAELGMTVDCVHWTNGEYVPEGEVDLLIDVRTNLEQWAPHHPQARKVAHLDTCHHRFNNEAQMERHRALTERRGVNLQPFKLMPETRGIETCDLATYLGNSITRASYDFADKPMTRIPVSVPQQYAWQERDWERARRRFVWFGSGGLVHKGLDLVLETFAKSPDLELLVCGPIDRERDFERHYQRELYRTPNINTLGWLDVLSPSFLRQLKGVGGLVYPSCAEGGGASALTCMHAGIVPLLTPEASVDLEEDRGVVLRDLSIDGLKSAVETFSQRAPSELQAISRNAWSWSREHHTRDVFATRFRAFAEELVTTL